MKPQFDHNLVSSFFLWVDHVLCDKAEAVFTGGTQSFVYSKDGLNVPVGFNAFYSSAQQLYAGHEDSPNSVFADGQEITQSETGSQKMIIDHNDGRILLDESFGKNVTVTGNFVRKQINLYTTNETEEEILLNREFFLPSGESSSQYYNQLAKAVYKFPCIFISKNFSQNRPFTLGGARDTKTIIKCVVFASSVYQLEGILSLFRDREGRNICLIDKGDFPYGGFWQVKDHPYSYPDLIAENKSGVTFIETVGAYKLRDGAQGAVQKIRKSLFMGYLDFELSSIRYV